MADIEDAAIVPPGSAIMGRQLGNWMWRSPEAHAEGPMHTPSDIFAFGIVVSSGYVFSCITNELPLNIVCPLNEVHLRRPQTPHLRRRRK